MIISHQYLCHHERPTCQVCPPSFLSQTASCPPFPQLLLLSSACGCREGESCDEQHMPLVHPISFSLSMLCSYLVSSDYPILRGREKGQKTLNPFCFSLPPSLLTPSASASDAGRKESPDPSPSESPPPPQTGSYTILYLAFGQFPILKFRI